MVILRDRVVAAVNPGAAVGSGTVVDPGATVNPGVPVSLGARDRPGTTVGLSPPAHAETSMHDANGLGVGVDQDVAAA